MAHMCHVTSCDQEDVATGDLLLSIPLELIIADTSPCAAIKHLRNELQRGEELSAGHFRLMVIFWGCQLMSRNESCQVGGLTLNHFEPGSLIFFRMSTIKQCQVVGGLYGLVSF